MAGFQRTKASPTGAGTTSTAVRESFVQFGSVLAALDVVRYSQASWSRMRSLGTRASLAAPNRPSAFVLRTTADKSGRHADTPPGCTSQHLKESVVHSSNGAQDPSPRHGLLLRGNRGARPSRARWQAGCRRWSSRSTGRSHYLQL